MYDNDNLQQILKDYKQINNGETIAGIGNRYVVESSEYAEETIVS